MLGNKWLFLRHPGRSPPSRLYPLRPFRPPSPFRPRSPQNSLQHAIAHGNLRAKFYQTTPDFYGPDSETSYVRSIFDAALKGGTADVIGPNRHATRVHLHSRPGRNPDCPFRKGRSLRKAWNVAGPGQITTRQFAELVFAAVDQKPRLRVPTFVQKPRMGEPVFKG